MAFVVYATRSALARAAESGFGVLELDVTAAILAGRVIGYGSERLVVLDGYLARTVKQDRTPGGRRRLLVTRLERINHNGGRRR